MNEARIIQNAYLAYYGRPADPAGLDYWAGRLKAAGGNLDEIIAAFGDSAEFTGRFGALGATELVNAIYQRLFKRDADPEGLAFYRGLLESGEKHLGSIALNIFNGVQREGERQSPPLDWQIIEEIQRTANAFTEQVRLGGLDYSGERGLEVGAQMIASVPHSDMELLRERAIDFAANGIHGFNLQYIHPDWYAGMFTSQLGEDRSVISIDRIADIGGSSIGHGDDRWGKIHTFWPAGEEQITFEGRFEICSFPLMGQTAGTLTATTCTTCPRVITGSNWPAATCRTTPASCSFGATIPIPTTTTMPADSNSATAPWRSRSASKRRSHF